MPIFRRKSNVWSLLNTGNPTLWRQIGDMNLPKDAVSNFHSCLWWQARILASGWHKHTSLQCHSPAFVFTALPWLLRKTDKLWSIRFTLFLLSCPICHRKWWTCHQVNMLLTGPTLHTGVIDVAIVTSGPVSCAGFSLRLQLSCKIVDSFLSFLFLGGTHHKTSYRCHCSLNYSPWGIPLQPSNG